MTKKISLLLIINRAHPSNLHSIKIRLDMLLKEIGPSLLIGNITSYHESPSGLSCDCYGNVDTFIVCQTTKKNKISP